MAFLTEAANRGSISTGYDIDNSCKFEADNSEQLYRTPSSAGNQKTWTYSVWFKRTELGASQQLISAQDTYMYFETTDQAWLNFRSGSENFFLATNRKFRDCSAWYHAVIVCETANSTAADRAQLWINGVRETDYANSTYQNLHSGISTGMNSTNVHRIGQYSNYGSKFSGYMAEINLVDGQALDPTYFGEFDDNGIWIPKKYTGTYGTNGFYLDFADASDLGDDESGNGNDWTEGAISSVDQATDSPTNNFCILNPVFQGNYYKAPTEGGTYIGMDGTNQYAAYAGTMGVTQGKWYYETYINSRSASYGLTVYVGYHTFQGNYQGSAYYNNSGQESLVMYLMHGGDYYTWNSGSRTHTGNPAGLGTSQVGQFVGVALNLDDNQISYYVNGSAISNASNLALDDLGDEAGAGTFAMPALTVYDNNHTVNFGGYTAATISSAETDANGYGTFEHAPPSGYYALCTKNLAEYG